MGRCILCGASGPTISSRIGVCADCLRNSPRQALEVAMRIHREYRAKLGLPIEPPRAPNGVECMLCVNRCSIPPNGVGFCGLWTNDGGKLKHVAGLDHVIVHYYLDPLPTNCVATPVCPAATGCGYPRYALRPGAEYGYYNLAVFFAGCNLDCVFCQNWEHKDILVSGSLRERYTVSLNEIVKVAKNDLIPCICYFGGDPGPHAPQAIRISRLVLDYAKKFGKIKRICWETNGLESPWVAKAMAELSLESGGIFKIDWKAWTPSIYQALTGVDGSAATENIRNLVRMLIDMSSLRKEVPLLVVSVLLVPGYVDVEEVQSIAKFIASLDRDVPLVLLAFHPDHLLKDLPPTSRRHAEEAAKVAREEGLRKVFIENVWLLGDYY